MIISYHEKQAIELALAHLNDKKIFIYPTDTLYGFGADARSYDALEALYELKRRPEHMPLSILVKDINMLETYAVVSDITRKLLKHFLPGALTLVLPSKPNDLPKRLFSKDAYLGFRIPNHEFCSKLSSEFKAPFITTSVNISGQDALNNIKAITKAFSHEVDLMICDDKLDRSVKSVGSTVILIDENSNLKVLREGLISEKELRAVI